MIRSLKEKWNEHPTTFPIIVPNAYLPHARVVVICFDFTGVDDTALKGSEPGPSGDDRLGAEHAVVDGSCERRLHDGDA